jgi:hypothetical protein
MSNEHTPVNTEQHETNHLVEVLENVGRRVGELEREPAFQRFLIEHGIDSNDREEYWRAVASYADQLVDGNEALSEVERASLALAANLPTVLISSYHLKHNQASLDKQALRTAKATACSYNNLLKHYVLAHPQPVDQLHQSLLGVTLQTIGNDYTEMTTYAETYLNVTFKGIKHEIGFSQILDTFPKEVVNYREATVEEDLKGQDVVITFNGHAIGVDVKASLSEIENKNNGSSRTPIARKSDGDLVMWSMLQDEDFGNSFTASPEKIAERAVAAGGFLQHALLESIAKR